jgi:hypothetical protein
MRATIVSFAFFACFASLPAWGQTSVRTGGFAPRAFIFHGQMSPFVTEIIPVVGGRPAASFESPLRGKLRMARENPAWRPPLRPPAAEEESSGRAAYAALEAAPALPERRAAGSSAERGEFSVAAIRRQQAADDLLLQAELDRLTAEARRLELAGDRRGAALVYSKAAAKVADQRREAFLAKARELRK